MGERIDLIFIFPLSCLPCCIVILSLFTECWADAIDVIVFSAKRIEKVYLRVAGDL